MNNKVILEAIHRAHQAYLEKMDEYGLDPSYFDIRIEVFQKDSATNKRFKRWAYEEEMEDCDER